MKTCIQLLEFELEELKRDNTTQFVTLNTKINLISEELEEEVNKKLSVK